MQPILTYSLIFSVLFLACLEFHLEFNSINIGVFGTPLELVALLFLDFENKTLGHVFLVELQVVHELLVNVAIGVAHEHAEPGLESARVVECEFAGDSFGVGVRFQLDIRNKGGGAQNQVHMTENASERILVPGETDREFARMSVAVVCAVSTFATEVDSAVGGAHIGDSYAKNVFFADFEGFLKFNGKGGVGTEMRAQELSVEPEGGMRSNAFEPQENALCDLLFFVDGESLEVEGAILRHKKFVKRFFPNIPIFVLIFWKIKCIIICKKII